MIMFTRRDWLVAASFFTTSALAVGKKTVPYRYVLANPLGNVPGLPDQAYIPFDWAFGEVPAVGNQPTEAPKLTWPKTKISKNQSVTLRIASATDVREACLLEARTAVSGRLLGTFDIRFAMYLQPFELPIQSADLPALLTEGITLTMVKGSKPFWFFSQDKTRPSAPTAFLPHLLIYENQPAKTAPDAGPPDRWKDRLLSLESVQSFGWMEGCVMDGLQEMSRTGAASTQSDRAKRVLQQHLDLFFGQNRLTYANLNNRKAVGIINTVESILPFAILAQTNPAHPLLQTAIQFCEKHANAEGVIADGTGTDRTVKTEEAYTVSYPLAVLAKTLNRPDLARLAIKTLQARVAVLDKDGRIHQRGSEQGTNPVFENWSRGVVWYLFGLVKTLTHLPDSPEVQSLKQTLQKAVTNVLAYQRPNGLWYCFMHQPETGYETSGTAGIAAALTYGVQHQLLPTSVLDAVEKARKGLMPYLTPDGYLTGTAQGNKGGDALQREGFRVISPYTLGFLAHLDRIQS